MTHLPAGIEIAPGAEPTLTASAKAAETRCRELLDLASSTTGLGTFERQFPSGAGNWNQNLFDIRGLKGDLAAPPFEAAAEGVVDADRLHFDGALRGSLQPRSDPVRQQHFRLRYRVHHPDGGIRHLHKQWIVRYGADGHPVHMRGVVVDETALQTMRRASSEAALQLSLAAEFTGMAVWQQDMATGLVQMNERALTLFDIEPHALPVPVSRLHRNVHPDDQAAAAAADAAALASRAPVDVDLRIRSRHDGWHRLLTRRGVQPAPDGGAEVLASVALDASAPTGQALASSVERCRLLTRVSHELRTPMNAVLGFAQLLSFQDSRETDVPPARRQAVGHINLAGQHLMALINDVLDLSRLEGGEMPLALAPVLLHQAASGALAMLDVQRQQRQMTVHTRGLDLCVLADATRLCQVLINLVGNAFKYGRAGGLVTIEAQAQPGGVCLRVADDGQGMNAEQLRHLFEPFNRLGAEKSAVQGTGLGLSISKALVERMGGSVCARSEPGWGTVFELLLLPAVPQAAVQASHLLGDALGVL